MRSLVCLASARDDGSKAKFVYLLIVEGVGGTVVGMLNSTISNITHITATALIATPHLPKLYGAFSTSRLPRAKEMAMGSAYDEPRHITLTPTNALNAVDDPR